MQLARIDVQLTKIDHHRPSVDCLTNSGRWFQCYWCLINGAIKLDLQQMEMIYLVAWRNLLRSWLHIIRLSIDSDCSRRVHERTRVRTWTLASDLDSWITIDHIIFSQPYMTRILPHLERWNSNYEYDALFKARIHYRTSNGCWSQIQKKSA